MRNSAIFPLLLGVFALAGCGADFDPGSRVTGFRVLAVQADAPFAAPGETVNLNALAYDPQGRTITWAWAACVNPAESTVEGCFAKIAQDAQTSGALPILAQGADQNTFAFTLPDDALSSLPRAVQYSAFVGIISAACPGTLSFEQGPGALPFRCFDATDNHELTLDEYAVGMKRIFVRNTDRNQNPTIANITFDHADWPENEVKTLTPCDTTGNDYTPCSGLSKHQIGAHITADSTESGTDEFGTPFTEQLIVDYYATEGIFQNDVRIASDPETGYAARTQSSTQDLTLWFIIHDNRGGTTWTTRTAHAN